MDSSRDIYDLHVPNIYADLGASSLIYWNNPKFELSHAFQPRQCFAFRDLYFHGMSIAYDSLYALPSY
jgi:hypothetical protein